MTDAELIEALGGPTRLSDELGYPRDGGPQRVSNWKTRGIPPAVKWERKDLFLRDSSPDLAPEAQGASHAG